MTHRDQLSLAHGADNLVVAGGVIPSKDNEFLKQAGCFDVYGPGTKIPVAAKGIIEALVKLSVPFTALPP